MTATRPCRVALAAAALQALAACQASAPTTAAIPVDATGDTQADAAAATRSADTADVQPQATCDTSPQGTGGSVSPVCAAFVSPGPVQKVSNLRIPAPTIGCDLTGDGQPDNALAAGLAQIVGPINDQFADNVAAGRLVLMLRGSEFRNDGVPFGLHVLVGQLDPGNACCNPVAADANCGYQVLPQSFEVAAKGQADACAVKIQFPNAKVAAGALQAGGPGQPFVLATPLKDLNIHFALTDAKLVGAVSTNAGAWHGTKDGLLCGVLTKPALAAAIDALPEDQLAEMGFDKPMLKGVIKSFLIADIASAPGGPLDAYSVAVQLETVQGHVTGGQVQP